MQNLGFFPEEGIYPHCGAASVDFLKLSRPSNNSCWGSRKAWPGPYRVQLEEPWPSFRRDWFLGWSQGEGSRGP